MKTTTALSAFAICLAASLAAPAHSEPEQETAPDLLTFAQGALPVSISTGETDLRVGPEKAISMIDGDPTGFGMLEKPAGPDDAVEIVIELPAATRFSRFAVPNITETPSPYQTFFKTVEIYGASDGADGSYTLIASGDLSTHDGRDQVTELSLTDARPEVRWVRIRLSGGIRVEKDKSFLEFSEIIGNGTQAENPLSDQFSGVWRGRGVKLELAQDGANVSGCYDSNSRLSGTVDGRVLRALGEDDAGIASQFILIADADGAIKGLRSTNGAPFKVYDGTPSDVAPVCLPPEPPRLGCGSVIHGISFDFDSDALRPSSTPVIEALFEGLVADDAATVQVIGHSSSEGSDAYNRDLSERRAQSVVDALVALGIEGSKLSAAGRGEDDPIASNDTEAGRSLNRRVEIRCSGTP